MAHFPHWEKQETNVLPCESLQLESQYNDSRKIKLKLVKFSFPKFDNKRQIA